MGMEAMAPYPEQAEETTRHKLGLHNSAGRNMEVACEQCLLAARTQQHRPWQMNSMSGIRLAQDS